MGRPKDKENYAESFLQGAEGPPRKPEAKKTNLTRTVNVRFTEADYEKVQAYFWGKHRLSAAAGIRMALQEYMKENP